MPETRSATGGPAYGSGIGAVAAAALVAEFGRHPVPKRGIVVSGTADSRVLAAAVDALTPDDRLVVAAGAGTAEMSAHVAALGGWVRRRVRVVATLAEIEPADAVILDDIVTGEADEVRAEIGELAKLLDPGGVLSAAVSAVPLLAGGAGAELDRLATLHGVGSDLVLRNLPPLRVHRLRFSPAEATLAERMRPLARTSSIRLTDDMHLDSTGVAADALCLGAALLVRRSRPASRLWLVPALATAGVAAFFRDPERAGPDDPAAVVAASDGRILAVERVHDERLGSEEFLRISTFLSILDVHVNRAPVAGRVVDRFTVTGGYAPAMKPGAEHNLATYTILDTTRGTVAVAQRAGLVARRIVHRSPVGTLLARGERFGLIRFGSRTDVYLPAQAAAASAAPGDRVVGGETVIARWT